MPLENNPAIEYAKEKVQEVWVNGILVFTAQHCYLLKQSKQRWLQMQTLLWINGSAFGGKKKVKLLLSVVDKVGINRPTGAPEPSFSHLVN